MARPLRISYPGAWLYVANRGAGRQRVFRNDEHRVILLELLAELRERFNIETHAYCLMSNRYDLILRTPSANLSPAMRHLNGVYTQRYNRLTGRDGALFRGRYRSVVFHMPSCLCAISRHIHRRPLATGNVRRLDRYRWSSYPSYVTRRVKPVWLFKETLLSHNDGNPRSYRQYVEQETESNELVRHFFRQPRPGAILGPDEFKSKILKRYAAPGSEVPKSQRLPNQVPPDRIIRAVCTHYQVPRKAVLASRRGSLNVPRLAALWLCRHRGHLSLAALAQQFGLAGDGSASAILQRVKHQMRPPFWRTIQLIEDKL